MNRVPRTRGLQELADRYDVILCDVWGVLHNGRQIWSEAADALIRFRQAGGKVVMITNAPRPKQPVLDRLEAMDAPDGIFDDLVTSGDVTRELIQQVDGSIYYLGPERDLTLFEGLEVTFSEPETASGVVCTGLLDDRSETPEDYKGLLQRLYGLELPFICANPDLVVEYGDRLLWCAGALARDYKALGGDTRIVGKPYAPIYDAALSRIGNGVDKARVLAIGDGLPTDIAGAQNNGLDSLYVSHGIHAGEYGNHDADPEEGLQGFLKANSAAPVAWMPRLAW